MTMESRLYGRRENAINFKRDYNDGSYIIINIANLYIDNKSQG